jgi:NAD(P)-dependent dehydrogenase (short-subunit alcohol dehydrogenase family)
VSSIGMRRTTLERRSPGDYLLNNAGRSIGQGIINSFDRFHDFERTIQLNYFGALRLILGFLPKISENKRGPIINISSIGVLSNAPRFSAPRRVEVRARLIRGVRGVRLRGQRSSTTCRLLAQRIALRDNARAMWRGRARIRVREAKGMTVH